MVARLGPKHTPHACMDPLGFGAGSHASEVEMMKHTAEIGMIALSTVAWKLLLSQPHGSAIATTLSKGSKYHYDNVAPGLS